AMPAAMPKIAPSDTGVVITRLGQRDESPWVTLNAPPYGSSTSSPRRYTSSRVSKASVRAVLRAVAQRSSISAVLGHGRWRCVSGCNRLRQAALACLVDLRALVLGQLRAHDPERIALPRALDLRRVSVLFP